tara:strand:- start:277 stop:483 length:207 start_codon:yes stop_codon:yes gene_type:complete
MEVFDYLVGWDPIEFKIVSVQMIKGFDNAVAGMESNGNKIWEIPSSDAYDQYDYDMVQTVLKEKFYLK